VKETATAADEKSELIFTYINDDSFHPLENIGEQELKISKLQKIIDTNENGNNSNGNKENLFVHHTSHSSPSKSFKNNEHNFIKMFIMADLEPSTLLFTIKYRKSDGLFLVYPDFNDSENPYFLEIDQNSRQIYTFHMENLSLINNEATLKQKQQQILKNVQDESCELMKKLKVNLRNEMSQNVPKFCRIILMMEIIDGKHFEFDNIHVQFEIKIPKFVKIVEGILDGTTHSSYKNDDGSWNFGYCHCIVLDIDDELMSTKELDLIKIHFDVISIDSMWKRERREGISSIKIPLKPFKSVYNFQLQCYRDLQGNNSLIDFIERFFLGGIRDVKYLNHTQKDVNNFYGNQTISTGILNVKVQQIQQIKNSYRQNVKMQSIDEVIESYHKAKLKLKTA
jgi:hypothetical protein